jgi:uncharacterized protein (DUF305 family)
MMECLLAQVTEFHDGMNASQKQMIAKMDAWLEEMKAWQKETTACQEATEVCVGNVKTNPEKTKADLEGMEATVDVFEERLYGMGTTDFGGKS